MEQKKPEEGINTFAKCLASLRDILDKNSVLSECPEAKEAIYEKYAAFAKMMVQGSRRYSEEIVLSFIKIINHAV